MGITYPSIPTCYTAYIGISHDGVHRGTLGSGYIQVSPDGHPPFEESHELVFPTQPVYPHSVDVVGLLRHLHVRYNMDLVPRKDQAMVEMVEDDTLAQPLDLANSGSSPGSSARRFG